MRAALAIGGDLRKRGAFTPPRPDRRWPGCRWPGQDAIARTTAGACHRGRGCGFAAAGERLAGSMHSAPHGNSEHLLHELFHLGVYVTSPSNDFSDLTAVRTCHSRHLLVGNRALALEAVC